MKLKNNPESLRSLELIQHSSMESKESVRNILKSFLSHAIIAYMRNEPIYFPYIGEIKVTYEGDDYKEKGKQARLKTELIPDENFRRLIGKAEDDDLDELTELFLSRITEKIGEYLE